MRRVVAKILVLVAVLSFLIVPVAAGSVVNTGQTTVTLDLTGGSVVPPTPPAPHSSTLVITADDAVKQMGYTVNGVHNADSVSIPLTGGMIVIIPDSLPFGTLLNTTFDFAGFHNSKVGLYFSEYFPDHPIPMTISAHLSLKTVIPPVTPPGGGGGEEPEPEPTPDTPSIPDTPEVTPTPSVTPTEEPTVTPTETPGSDEPGSDEPYTPILPPAGSVHTIAGFASIAAGFFLLFLLFAFRGNLVYRILKKHAKRGGHDADKDMLKETAKEIVALIRNEERFPKWRTDAMLTRHLTAEIGEILDRREYPPVPRDAVLKELIKAAKGRINRHRL